MGVLLCLFCLFSCKEKSEKADNAAFQTAPAATSGGDFDHIVESGELIVATLSGPDTYFDYHGTPFGLQYALAADFARTEGIRLRVELATDTAALCEMLQKGEADIAVLQLPMAEIGRWKLAGAGAADRKAGTSWAVLAENTQLAEALDAWYGVGVEVSAQRTEQTRLKQRRTIRRKVRAPYISREKGIISTYDDLFRQAAATTGWDWRLIAAQCYQESGFDPNAVSYAGAKGLMQLMPATAAHLGVGEADIFTPSHNVGGAARLIRELTATFSDIRDRSEKIKFVLAAYNGGAAHIRDAQALARKYGKNPCRWSDVREYVLALQQPRYYRDPVVRNGYMIGSETYAYVEAILQRWRDYGGQLPAATILPQDHYVQPQTGGEGQQPAPRRRNRFTKNTRIYDADDPEFITD